MWAKVYKAAPPDSLAADWPVAAATFAQGKAAMMLNFSDTSETILGKDSKVASTVGFAPLPTGPSGKRTPNLGGWGIGINAKSKSQQQAFDFIAWATSAAGQKAGLAFGGSATRASVLNDASLQKKYPYFKAALANFKASVPFPQATNWVDWEAAMAPPMSEALGGQRSLASGLTEAQKRLAPQVKKEFGKA
jgi:multiple sugar transport system substrate-binding protein